MDFVTVPIARFVSEIMITYTPGFKIPTEPYYEACTVTLRDPDGSILIDGAQADVKVRGNWTTTYDKKPLRIRFNEKQSMGDLNDGNAFRNWVLLAEYKDASMLRNKTALSMAREICESDGMYASDAELVEVDINGEYWGVYFLQEKINAAYFEDHYGVSKSSVNLLVGNGRSRSEVKSGSNESYLELLNFCKENDLSRTENYEWVKQHMDVKNYAQYVATEMYTTNTDTGNIKFWMSEEYDGRWRWILYDTDWALLRQNAQKNYTEEYIDPRGHGVGNGFDTDIIVGLLKNAEFKQLFLETCAYITNTVYSEEALIGMVNEVAGQIDSSMERDRNRWSPCDREGGTMVTLSYKGWQANVESIRTFARTRREYFIEDVQQDLHVGASLIAEIFGDY